MATLRKIRGYAIIPKGAEPWLAVTGGDRLPRARTIRPADSVLTDRDGRAFAQAVKGHAPGIYRATFTPARLGQPPSVRIFAKPVKLADEIAALDKQAKAFAEARTSRRRMLPQQAESVRLAGIRSRVLADALRANLGRSQAMAVGHEAIYGAPTVPKAGFPVYRIGADGAPVLLATAADVQGAAAHLKTHGLEAALGNVYALDVVNGLKLTLAPEVR